jgi:2-polyprenyl-3-methyl-5-hydroxy-6-metoxy-1,4-benzoquinol methylase
MLCLPGIFSLVQCVECDMVYQNPRLEPHELAAYYPQHYDPFIPPPWANPDPVKRILHLYGLKRRWRLVEQWAPRRSGKRSILDIGCATGAFLAAGSADWQVVGVEPSAEAARIAQEQLGLKIYSGTIEQAPLEPGQFDVVTMWDVLEHVTNPYETLSHVKRLLRPDGVLVARVPNLDAWDARLFGHCWAGLDQPRHIFVPSEATLTRLLQKAGFTLIGRHVLIGSYAILMLNWRLWLRQRVHSGAWHTLAYRLLDNLPARFVCLPFLWLLNNVVKKAPLITIIARPVSP